MQGSQTTKSHLLSFRSRGDTVSAFQDTKDVAIMHLLDSYFSSICKGSCPWTLTDIGIP